MSGFADAIRRAALGEAHARRGAQLLLLFLLLRLALVGVTLLVPEGGVLIDSGGYLALRNRLIETGQYANLQGSAQDLNWPPGYPAFLALVRMVAGSSLWPVTLLQLAFSGALSLIVLRWAGRAAGANAGLLGAWLLALSPNAAVWSLTVMSEVLFAALLALAAGLLFGWHGESLRGRALAAGALLGVAAYVRPIALLLLPAWLICLGWLAWRQGAGAAALKAALAFGLAAILVAAPWVARNAAVHGEAVFSKVGAKTLLNFNLAEVLANAEGISRNEAAARLDDDRGTAALVWDLLRDHPTSFMKTQTFGVVRVAVATDIGTWGNVFGWDDWTGLGLLSALFGREGSVAQARPAAAWESGLRYGLLLISLLHAALFLSLAAVGMLGWPGGRARLLFWLPLLTIALLVLTPGASGQARFRVPVEPYLALFAGVGAARLTRLYSSARAAGDRDDLTRG